MIRVKSEVLHGGVLPVYDYPKDWPYDVFFVDKDGKNICQIEKKSGRVYLPQFEVSHQAFSSSVEEVRRQTYQKALRFMADVCVALRVFDGRVTMPIMTDSVIGGQDSILIGVLHLSLMLTRDDDPSEVFSNPSWVPDSIPDIEDFAENLERHMLVMEVMAE